MRLSGVTIRQASLHNFEDLARKDLRAGDMVVIRRAGDVIPQVLHPIVALRTGDETPMAVPTNCPVCGEAVMHEVGEVAVYCVNAACPAQVVRRIEHWASRGAMDIDGLGIQLTHQLVQEGLVHDVADLYGLRQEDLEPLEGFKEKKATNLVAAIDASRDRPLWRLLTGLGIHGVGNQVASVLADHYRSLDALMAAPEEQLQEIEGIGPKIAHDVVAFIEMPRNRELIAKLAGCGLRLADAAPAETATAEAPLDGMTFVITGTLPTMSREAAAALVIQHGGKVTGSVSGNTTYLVIGDKPGASKFNKAQKLGVPLLDEDALWRLIRGETPSVEQDATTDAAAEEDPPAKADGQTRMLL